MRLSVWFGVTLAALGCAQITGIAKDYRLADAGAGGELSMSGSSTGGAGGGPAASGGDIGVNGGDAGDSSAEAGANSGVGGSRAGSGSGGSSAGASSAGASGLAGAAGGSAIGPVHIGASQFHDSAGGGDGASADLFDATFAKPAGTAQGDFMLVYFGADHSLRHLTVNDLKAIGWTLLDQHQDYGGDGQATYLAYKFATANEPASFVFKGINDKDTLYGVQGLLSVYRGVNPTEPVNAYEEVIAQSGVESTDTFTTKTPAITTTVDHCLVIAGLSPDTLVDAPEISTWPAGFDENRVSVLNPAHPVPNGWANIYSAEKHLALAGPVAESAFVWKSTTGTKYFGSLAFVLALAP